MQKRIGRLPFLTAVLASTLVTSAFAAPPTDLLISEYIEGSSFNKAIEIYNGTGGDIDLTAGQYRLELHVNGGATAGQDAALSGTLLSGGTLVLCHASADANILSACNVQNSTVINHNGDDAYVLRKNSTARGVGDIVDSFGANTGDPGSGWGSGIYTTNDHTLRRKADTCAGDTNIGDAFDPSVEWDSFANNTFDGLGSHSANCGAATPNLSIDDVSIAEGNAGEFPTLTFTVTIDTTSASDVTFDVASVDGTAMTADGDYDAIIAPATSGTITAGNLTTTIDVTVNGDATLESDETFTVELSNVVGANVTDSVGTGTILDDDTPRISIADATASEGDGAGNNLTFDVTLDLDATAEFTVTYTLVDGSATGGSDYNNAGSGGTVTFIGGDAGTRQIIVPTIGDTDYEGDETFTVVISNVSAGNAVIADNTGVGTIQNDDRAPIHVIQGAGTASPLAGQSIEIAAAIVTAVGSDRFFMQMADADADMDPLTSEGLVVYTGGAPTVSVGDEVEVDGTIVEFFNLTEVSPTTNVAIIGSGNPLPTPVEFSAGSGMPSTDPTALTCPGTGPGGTNNVDTNFECFEGMRVWIPEAVALQGNRRRGGDDYAEIQFSPRAERSLREPGVRFPDSTTASNPNAGMWDGNPEVLEMDADILGAVPNQTEIAGGARFIAEGVLTFDFGDYVLWPTDLVIDDTSNLLPRPVDAPLASSELTVGSFNMLRLCDTLDNQPLYDCDGSGSGVDGEPDAAELAAKLVRLSAYVREVMLSPDVLGVQEVETLDVLEQLATQIGTDGGPAYSAYLVDGNDGGGIDVGYLVRDDRVKNAVATQYLQGETWDDPDCSPCSALLHDRPPLLLQADFQPNPGDALFPFAVINNHGRSRGGVDTGDNRVRAKRFTQAESIAGLVQDFQTASGVFAGTGTDAVPLILVGDYNAYQFTDGYADVVGMIAGTYDDDANTCSPSNAVTDCKLGGPNIVTPALQNLVLSTDADEQYSFIFTENFGAVHGYGTPNPARDIATGQVLDHVLVNTLAEPYVSLIQFGRANLDASVNGADLGSGPDGAGGTQASMAIGSSDHDGLVAYFETNCANLTIAPGSEPDPDEDGVCTFADNCPAIANNDQTDANGNGLGAACDATPVAVNDPAAGNYAATEDTTLNVPAAGLLANDTDTDGDSLSASLVDDSAANGTVTVNTDGSFDYSPNLNFCDDINPVSFTYAASDDETTSTAATASILVACVNDAPAISDIASPQMTDEEVSVMVAFTISDVDSTLDCSAANLTATSSNTTLMPVSGIVFSGTAPNCTATLTPAANQTGNSTIRITVSDGALDSFDEFVLSVSNVDDPAVLSDDSALVNEDAPATAIDVLANDVDPDSPLQITGVTAPANGTVTVTGGGSGLTYQPDANYCNDGVTTDDFTYDANGQTANVSVTVNCVDDDAEAVADAATVTQNSVGNVINVLANDTSDPDFALAIDSADASSAQGGSVSIDGSQISYTPAAGFCGGTDSFDYTLVGGSSATVTVTVDCLAPAIFADGFED